MMTRKEGYPFVTIGADWGLTLVQGVKLCGAMVLPR